MAHVLHCISSFKGTSYEKLHDATSPFVSYCFTLASFIYISRYDFLQVFRTSFSIIEINIFVTNSPFLIDSPKPFQLFNSQNPLNVTIIFLLMLSHLRLPNIAAKKTLPL